MHSHTVGFVGGGRITAILLEGLGGREVALDRVTVSDTSTEALAKLAVRFPAIATTADNSQAAGCERVFVALHPPALKAVLPELAPHVRRDAVVVSLAPVVTLAQLSQLLGGFTRLARVVPNAPSIVGAGFNPVAFADGLPAGARAEIEALLERLGAHPVVPEDTLEAYAILAAMGPTYFWFQWQQLRDLAGSFGLPARDADRALRAMLDGAVRTLFDSGLSAAQVMDLVPVKPLAESEPQILQVYRDVLSRLHAKLKPQTAHST
jgi:pyrroline-5-carboxylate reductase